MGLAPVSSPSADFAPPPGAPRQQFGQLATALQAGNLQAAQSAYSALTQNGTPGNNSPFARALDQIGNALQAGDLGGAQQALASLQQQMQNAPGAHHHRGDADGDNDSSKANSIAGGTDPTSSSNQVDMTA